MLSIFNQDILLFNLTVFGYVYKDHLTEIILSRTLQYEMMHYRYKSCIKSVYVNNFFIQMVKQQIQFPPRFC